MICRNGMQWYWGELIFQLSDNNNNICAVHNNWLIHLFYSNWTPAGILLMVKDEEYSDRIMNYECIVCIEILYSYNNSEVDLEHWKTKLFHIVINDDSRIDWPNTGCFQLIQEIIVRMTLNWVFLIRNCLSSLLKVDITLER